MCEFKLPDSTFNELESSMLAKDTKIPPQPIIKEHYLVKSYEALENSLFHTTQNDAFKQGILSSYEYLSDDGDLLSLLVNIIFNVINFHNISLEANGVENPEFEDINSMTTSRSIEKSGNGVYAAFYDCDHLIINNEHNIAAIYPQFQIMKNEAGYIDVDAVFPIRFHDVTFSPLQFELWDITDDEENFDDINLEFICAVKQKLSHFFEIIDDIIVPWHVFQQNQFLNFIHENTESNINTRTFSVDDNDDESLYVINSSEIIIQNTCKESYEQRNIEIYAKTSEGKQNIFSMPISLDSDSMNTLYAQKMEFCEMLTKISSKDKDKVIPVYISGIHSIKSLINDSLGNRIVWSLTDNCTFLNALIATIDADSHSLKQKQIVNSMNENIFSTSIWESAFDELDLQTQNFVSGVLMMANSLNDLLE